MDITVSDDGTIFTSQSGDGLRAFTYDGDSFTFKAHIDQGGYAFASAVGPDGTVFLANQSWGLMAYSYTDSSFNPLGNVYVGGYAVDVEVDTTGYILVAAGGGGLRAYTFGDSTFTPAAILDEFNHVGGVTVAPNGVVYAAANLEGMYAFDFSGIVGINEKIITTPAEFLLFQNYPNPFNPSTAIGYQLSAVSFVNLTIYNALGQKIKTLVHEQQSAGTYQVKWDASGFSSGMYFYKLETPANVMVRKMLLIK